MKLLLIILAAVIFSVVSVGGLVALRGLTNLVLRAILFLALCSVAYSGSLSLAQRWDFNPIELGYAWVVALLIVAGVEALRFWRRKRIIA